MTEPRFEQYKEALRQGHMAAMRGRLDVAAAAYRDAARIAPDRALPYVGLGGVLARLGRATEALDAYTAALERAPADEGAIRGRADMLATVGRPAEAADSLDRLATILERDDRIADACDVARQALELAESRARRRHLESLVARLRPLTDDGLAADALKRAEEVLGVGLGAVATPPAGAPVAVKGTTGDAAPVAPAPTAPRAPDPALLTLAVEEALEAGDLDEARRRALLAAAGHRAVGQFDAAMDACYQALAILPSDPEVHLALAELYLDRGWRGPAADKLVLLGRLTHLTGDGATRARVCYMAAVRFPEDTRLAEVCG
jgi:tetratricopeptide (TPR) repeat protein